ncbi:peptide/nickel transport system substrate-binding protein [Mesorhizobium soli]|uniref:ABC transporter substrate-binding protein n=1 Tax=Pseudaminobacter soli (ex Li et al. 2025) TaxID=1295366 RepID=UPI002476AEBE|nr:peptide ABC transporter substrate-binding protein [Mesorhizobium soli]MDH6233909.1 peptide/nickel transport system substrate-binding protein [Mesorhizobium soli]
MNKKPHQSWNNCILTLAATMITVVALQFPSAPTASATEILRIGTTQPIDSLNPFVSDSDYSSVTYQYVYPHLTEYNAKLEIVPSFATRWETSTDGKTWTFHTVPGASWSDGEPLTAMDAAFTFNMIRKFEGGATGKLAGWIAHMTDAKATDDNTLVLAYELPVANVLTQLQALPILPQHVWEPLMEGNGEQISTFPNSAPVVSGGPFMLTRHDNEQIALFARNPNWWGEKKPIIDGFGLQFFANDDAMITALVTDKLDMIGEQTPPTAVETLEKAGVTVSSGPGVGLKTLIINTNPDKPKNRELLDPQVREALEYAIDREMIDKIVWLGFSTPGSTIVAPATGFHDDAIMPLPYDIDKANEILDDKGFGKGNGIRLVDGKRMSYEVIFPTEENGTGDRAFQIIQAGFKKIGIEITQRKMDPGAATEAIQAPEVKYLDFDLAMWNWVPPVEPDFVLSIVTCAARGGNSDSGYCNADYDGMYAKQGTLLDKKERLAEISAMQKHVFEARPYIVLTYPNVIEAHSPKWDGFVLSPLVGSVNNLSTETLMNVHKVQ